jgi:hypothetical protein
MIRADAHNVWRVRYGLVGLDSVRETVVSGPNGAYAANKVQSAFGEDLAVVYEVEWLGVLNAYLETLDATLKKTGQASP